ncbi:DUF1127 domain-containing protein [Tabrizicola sp. BL-A-41-H6]|uniref:DUF1127 domain-containing protein n=1 Tax=Tabrizicola sp. BL-A-41-H6 TaxID=3421107 RepID=UPI003D67132E
MSRAPTLVRATPTATGLLRAVIDTVVAWSVRRRERAMLARLDSHLLRDIGLDPETAAVECAKPIWQP